MKLLIIGGAGYFGSRLAEALVREHEVTVTYRRRSTAREEWVRRAGVRVVEYDSSQHELIPTGGLFDAVINLAMPSAAEAGNDAGAALLRATKTVNAVRRLLDDGLAQRLVHFSTFHVYGVGGRAQFHEDDEAEPIHPYGQIHLACEQLLLCDPRAFVLRPSNLVGVPCHGDLGDQAKLLFVDLCKQAASGSIKLRNDGLSWRDFLPFKDAIDAIELLLKVKSSPVKLFNLASGESLRLDTVARVIQRSAAVMPTIELGQDVDAFREPFTVTTERLRALGWRPQAALADEARRLIEFFS